MGSCDHDQPMTPELDAAVARAAMAEGDLRHAAHHVAGALASDPHRPDLLALLDALTAAAGGPTAVLALFPLDGSPWYGTVAVHARLLRESAPDRAFDLLCQVAAVAPDVPYLAWAEGWAETASAPLDPKLVGQALGHLLAIDAAPGTPATEATFAPALKILAATRARCPDEAALWPITSMLYRRAGRPDEALGFAREGYERFPSWNAAVALANACRAVGRWDDAERAWASALTHDPADLSVRLDWADALLDRQDFVRARAKYQEVLDREPAHPWAVPSALYVDWARNPSSTGRLVLSRYAETHPDNARAQRLADLATPWVGRLPGPTEATVNALAQIVAKPGAIAGKVGLTLSHLESPSSQLVARRLAAEHGGEVRLTFGAVQQPDPRLPEGHVRWRLWRWDGNDAYPALPEPPDPARQVLGKLAGTRYHAPTWLDQAGDLALRHGVDVREAAGVELVLAAALHPIRHPSWSTPWDWAFRVAHAAAFVLAAAPGWEGTPARDGLTSMLGVRNDWLAVGAIAAICERARREPAVRAEMSPRLVAMLRSGPDAGGWCLAWPLTCGLFRMGQQEDDELRHALANHLRGFEDPPPSA